MIHPCAAPDDKGVSHSAECDKGSALDLQAFKKA